METNFLQKLYRKSQNMKNGYLLLCKILTASEVLRELATSKFHSVCSCKVCTTCCQSLLVIQFLNPPKNLYQNYNFHEINIYL